MFFDLNDTLKIRRNVTFHESLYKKTLKMSRNKKKFGYSVYPLGVLKIEKNLNFRIFAKFRTFLGFLTIIIMKNQQKSNLFLKFV